jgi:molybdate transport system substrate-binding protein
VKGRARLLGVVVASALSCALPARSDDVLVFAAASLTDALQELGAAFARRSGEPVTFSFGASGALARQILAGARADVFVSADAASMDEVQQAGLVEPAERRDLLSNVLVVVVPGDAITTIGTPAELTSVARIALANPESVPAGIYARSWLASLGLWEQVRDRVVPTVDVRAALAAVEAGHAGAAIVYATDAAIARRVRVAYTVPRAQGPPIVYVVAPLRESKQARARDLVRFLSSPDAARTFERLGFIALPSG